MFIRNVYLEKYVLCLFREICIMFIWRNMYYVYLEKYVLCLFGEICIMFI